MGIPGMGIPSFGLGLSSALGGATHSDYTSADGGYPSPGPVSVSTPPPQRLDYQMGTDGTY